ncbi:MAG: F-box protein, partial [Chlamydiota bacterium]
MTTSINLSLPLDVWAKTISFLVPKEQLAVSRVNTLWRQAFHMPICQLTLMQSIAKLPLSVRRISLELYSPLIEHLINLQFNEVLDPHNKHKGEFLAQIIESKFEYGSSNAMEYLRTLSEENRKAITFLNFQCCAAVLSLDLTDEQVEEILLLCPNLKSLTLEFSCITGEGLAHILEQNQLEKICLKLCLNLDERFLRGFFQKAVCLKEVDLSESNTTGEGFAHILEQNQLEKICLKLCLNLDERFLRGFFQKAVCLKEVDLSGSNTTGEGFAHILEKNQLEKLCLKYC